MRESRAGEVVRVSYHAAMNIMDDTSLYIL